MASQRAVDAGALGVVALQTSLREMLGTVWL
jgi:hypothetical protein